MVTAVLETLQPRSGGRYVDATVGGGGHAEAILKASSPDGFLYGSDRDASALEAAAQRLAPYAGRFELRQANFSELAGWIGNDSCDGLLLDLGVSSPQLDRPERGFSFQSDGPLDMRMDVRQALTAADVVNNLDESELTRIFREYGEEPQARRIARAIAQARTRERFETTGKLAWFIESLAPRSGKRHPATRVFQALRIAVNNELEALSSALAAACTLLKPGGRLAVITFHSVEDRIVKNFGREQTRDYIFPGEVDVPELRQARRAPMKWVQRKLKPDDYEIAQNPRARSAQLRVLEKN
jgi:16S rRNA (cytosine1402-N4)-methyltransferase